MQVLHDLLQQSNGVVSSLGLRHALEQRNIPDARRLVVSLKYFDFDAPPEDGRPKPPFHWYSHARSFYTEEQFAKLKNAQDHRPPPPSRPRRDRPLKSRPKTKNRMSRRRSDGGIVKRSVVSEPM